MSPADSAALTGSLCQWRKAADGRLPAGSSPEKAAAQRRLSASRPRGPHVEMAAAAPSRRRLSLGRRGLEPAGSRRGVARTTQCWLWLASATALLHATAFGCGTTWAGLRAVPQTRPRRLRVPAGATNGGSEQLSTLTVVVDEDAENSQDSNGIKVGRIGGRTAGRKVPPRPTEVRPPPASSTEQGEGPLGALKTVAAVLLALWLGRALLEFTLFSSQDTDTYYVSSRSMVAVTTIDENGQRRTNVQEDSNVRTNIPGLRKGDTVVLPSLAPFGYFDGYQ